MVLALLSLGNTLASAATYYVSTSGNDANSGVPSAPWRTIQKAANSMVAGDTAIVSGGTYNEKIRSVRSGSSSARITFKTTEGARVLSFSTVDHDYITVDGFEMTGANDGYMLTWAGNYGELLNATIHDTGASWGIVRGDGVNLTIRGNRYYSSSGPGDDLPVFILGGNSIAENNEIGPAKDIDAFRVWGAGNIIRGNYIHDATLTSGSSAHMDVVQTFAVNCSGCTSAMVFEKNRVINNGAMQIFMSECNASCATMGPWDIRDNIFVGVGGQANFGIRNIRFYNNTLYNSGGNNNLVLYLYDGSGKSDYSGAVIKNNLVVVPSGISSYGQVMSVGSTGSNVQISNNFITKIGTWSGVSGFADQAGINGGDPKFVNAAANDFHLQSGSPAVDRGATVSGFNYDFDGTMRPQGGAWDIGAFESGGADPTSHLPAPTNLRSLP
jgi:serralysin